MSLDRSVNLADLAALTRAESSGGPRGPRARSDCRNPECVNGMTPGLTAVGGGSKGQPLFGAGGVGAKKLMRWGWINCPACNPAEGTRRAGAVYKHLGLNETQIAQRAQLATTRAAYSAPATEPSRPARTGQPLGGVSGVPDSGRLAELMEVNKKTNERLEELLKQNVELTNTISRMSMQVASLLEDNAKLREQLAKSVPIPQSLIQACAEPARIPGTLTLPKKEGT